MIKCNASLANNVLLLFESVVKLGIHYTMLAKQKYFYPIQGATCSLLPYQLDY